MLFSAVLPVRDLRPFCILLILTKAKTENISQTSCKPPRALSVAIPRTVAFSHELQASLAHWFDDAVEHEVNPVEEFAAEFDALQFLELFELKITVFVPFLGIESQLVSSW